LTICGDRRSLERRAGFGHQVVIGVGNAGAQTNNIVPLAIRPFASLELPPDLNRHAGMPGKETVMHLNLSFPLGLFDPHLQLEAEPVDGPLCWPADQPVNIHAQIDQTIEAIDRLRAHLQLADEASQANARH
jgi:hypothetical protein